MRHDTLSKTNAIRPTPGHKNLLTTMSGRTLWSYRKNSADLDLLKSDRPLVYSSKMAEETGGVTDKVAPSQRSTK